MASTNFISQTQSKFKNKVAIITGASSGVGQACAIDLAKMGCRVVINYSKSSEGALHTQKECEAVGGEVLVYQADVANDDECKAMVAACVEHFGGVDFLVNNAGTTKFCNHHDLDGLDKDDFLNIYAVNAVGPYQMVRAVSSHMKEKGGVIVNVASIAGLYATGSSIAYCASKAALLNMTKSLARVLGPEVRVNAVCPGFIQGEWLKQGLGEEVYEMVKGRFEKTSPLKTTASAETVSESILMLLAGPVVMTGEHIVVDGGQHLAV